MKPSSLLKFHLTFPHVFSNENISFSITFLKLFLGQKISSLSSNKISFSPDRISRLFLKKIPRRKFVNSLYRICELFLNIFSKENENEEEKSNFTTKRVDNNNNGRFSIVSYSLVFYRSIILNFAYVVTCISLLREIFQQSEEMKEG